MDLFFKHHNYLYGLFFIVIPIIVHLFNFRRYKTVLYSDISFLQSVTEKSKSQSQLKHLLILASRILFIVSLVMIFAQAYLSKTDNNTQNNKDLTISIYIDNSFSSSLENEKGILLENYKKNAINIANAYKGKAKFLLLSNDMPAKYQYLLNYNNLSDYISEITISHKSKNINEIIDINSDIIKNIKTNKLYILSDFQYNFLNKELSKYDSLNINLIPSELSKTNNISVDTCWFDLPNRKFGQKEKLHVKINSFSAEDLTDLPVKLLINDSVKAVSSIDIEAGTEQTLVFNYTNTQKANYNCEIKIEDYPIVFDNSLFFSYRIKNEINILAIGDKPNKYLEAIFSVEDYFSYKYQNNNAIEYSAFNKNDVIIMYGNADITNGFITEINKYIEQGGSFILIPNINKENTQAYNNFLGNVGTFTFSDIDTNFAQIKNIDNNIDIFKDLFEKIDAKTILPKINSCFKTNKNNYNTEIVLVTKDNTPLLFRKKFGKGNLYIFTFNAVNKNEENFNKSPLFLPLFYNVALSNQTHKLFYYISNSEKIEYHKFYDEPINISNKNYNVDFISQTSKIGNKTYLNIDNYITKSTNYSIKKNKEIVDVISFNYNRSESDMTFTNINEIKRIIENNKLKNWQIFSSSDEHLTQEITNSYGKQLWYYFVILALFFLALETVFIRLFKIKRNA